MVAQFHWPWQLVACLTNLVNHTEFQGPACTALVDCLARVPLSLPAYLSVCSARLAAVVKAPRDSLLRPPRPCSHPGHA